MVISRSTLTVLGSVVSVIGSPSSPADGHRR
jgi:hypothetical protein